MSRDTTPATAPGAVSLPASPAGSALPPRPTFALMALWNALGSAPPDIFCMQHASPLTGMTAMYALMSTFHVVPWLRLIGARS
jgi:hypothetical protein